MAGSQSAVTEVKAQRPCFVSGRPLGADRGLAFSPEGELLAYTSRDRLGVVELSRGLTARTRPVAWSTSALAFELGGDRLLRASGAYARGLEVWDLARDEAQAPVPVGQTWAGTHLARLPSGLFAMMPLTSPHLPSGGSPLPVVVFDLGQRKELLSFSTGLTGSAGLAWSANHRFLAGWDRVEDLGVCLWEVEAGRALPRLRLPERPTHAAISDDGSRAVVVSASDVSVWELGGPGPREVARVEHRAWRVQLRPDGGQFLLELQEGGLLLCDGATGQGLHRLEGYGAGAFLPGGQHLLQLVAGGFVERECSTGRPTRRFEVAQQQAGPRVSPDGRWAAALDQEEGAKVWELQAPAAPERPGNPDLVVSRFPRFFAPGRYAEPCATLQDDDQSGVSEYMGSGVEPQRHPLYGVCNHFTACRRCRSQEVRVVYARWSVSHHSGDASTSYEVFCPACRHYTSFAWSD